MYRQPNFRNESEQFFVSPELRDKWIINLTNELIPPEVLDLACLGKNFGVPYMGRKSVPIENIIARIESLIGSMDSDEQINIRSDYMSVINNYLKSKHKYTFSNKLKNRILLTQNFRQEHEDIIFLKADKGNMTVVMKKESYIDKMMILLQDKSTYREIKYNPTKMLQYHVKKIINKWYENSFISEYEKIRLSLINSNIARAYGSPKIHKPNIPFRIIVSFVNTPTYELAKYLQRILEISLKLEFNRSHEYKMLTANSRSLISNIYQLNLPKDFIMISMDVVSLFTNIPVKLAVVGIEKRWDLIKYHTKIPMNEFIEAIKLCFNSSAFVFNGIFYQQVYGAAMGSPLSPIIAEIVMQDLENFSLEKLDFPIYFYTRYVDDILVFLPYDKVDIILSAFNNYHERISFTLEREQQCQINFLELKLIRSSNNIVIDWYQKPTSTGRYLNYFSHHPTSYKVGVIKTLVDKAVLLCDKRFRNKNLAFVRQSLINNGYPARLIKTIIRTRVPYLLFKNRGSIHANEHRKNYINRSLSLPYVAKLSESLKFVLKKSNIHVAFKNCNNLSWIFKGHKDSLSALYVSHAVYRIPCCECKFVFIGHTKHQLGILLQKHRFSLDNPHLAYLTTDLTDHAFRYFHNFDFTKIKILTIEPISRIRILLTEIYIQRLMNNNDDESNIRLKITWIQ